MNGAVEVGLTVNGEAVSGSVEPRLTLADFLRTRLGLTGTHLGCEHGVCGACTVLLNGEAIRSCLLFAVQANNSSVTTVEGLAEGGELHAIQRAFLDNAALQCGFCTSGMMMAAFAYLAESGDAVTREGIESAIAGNICRCTGYESVIQAVLTAAGKPS